MIDRSNNADDNGNIIEIFNDNGESIYSKNIPGVKLYIKGKNNYIKVHEGTKFENCAFQMANYNKVVINKSKYKIQNVRLFANSYTIFEVGYNFSCLECDIRLQENRTGFIIGNDCMFSTEIRVYATDGYAIYSIDQNKVLNIGKIITIGNHVWIGRRVNLLKGTKINDNSIVGFGSVVTGNIDESNVVIAGFPAKVIKTGVNWSRLTPEEYERVHPPFNENMMRME